MKRCTYPCVEHGEACDQALEREAAAVVASARILPRVNASREGPTFLHCCCGCQRGGTVHVAIGGLLVRLAPKCAAHLAARLYALSAGEAPRG